MALERPLVVEKLTGLYGLALGEGLNGFPNAVVWFDL